jgi:hypothetical protein
MGNGLLAQWRSRIVGRGTATAALLAVPVVVAGIIGSNGGLGGAAGGFFAALDGPDQPAAGAVTPGGAGLDAALAALVGPPDAPGPGDEPRGPGPEGPGTPGSDPPGGAPGPGTDPSVELPDVPDPTVPVGDPQGGVDGFVDDVNRTVDGIVGNP